MKGGISVERERPGKRNFCAREMCYVDGGEKGEFSFPVFDAVDCSRGEIANFKCNRVGICSLFC